MILNNNTDYHNSRIEEAERIYNSDSLLPYRYALVLTNKCNLKCEHCFHDEEVHSLSFQEINKLFIQLKNSLINI